MQRLKKRPAKANNAIVTPALLQQRAAWSKQLGHEKQKWVMFCETLLERGYNLTLYEARQTVSKYITVRKGDKKFKVRFSNHMPILAREANGDCDFFVGRTNLGISNTHNALHAVERYFNG